GEVWEVGEETVIEGFGGRRGAGGGRRLFGRRLFDRRWIQLQRFNVQCQLALVRCHRGGRRGHWRRSREVRRQHVGQRQGVVRRQLRPSVLHRCRREQILESIHRQCRV